MSESPHRPKPGKHEHLSGRYRQDSPPPAERGSPEDWVSRPWRFLLYGLLLSMGSAFIVAVLALALYSIAPPGPLNNVVWLGISWGEDEHSNEQVEDLTRNLERNGIGTAYVWLSFLQRDDTWTTAASTNMAAFVGQYKIAFPEGQLYAWISVPTTLPEYRLGDEELRAEIAAYCAQMALDFGFDGVHLNAEPLFDGDDNFTALLRGIRQALGPDVPLSVTVPPEPLAAPQLAWSAEYKQRIALLADEMVIMAYNSSLTTPAEYQDWMAQQVNVFVSAIAPLEADTRLIFGIPTYDDEPAHVAAAENVATAISGVQSGLDILSEEEREMVTGLGVYAYWTTDAQEWQDFRQMWLGEG